MGSIGRSLKLGYTEDMKYPTHKAVGAEIRNFVELCLDNEYMHNREGLEDLIADLMQYRNTLPTCEQYMEAGEL